MQRNISSYQQQSSSSYSKDSTPLQQSSGIGTNTILLRVGTNDFSSSIKDDRLSMVKEVGRVSLEDVKGVTPTTMKFLNTIGVWSPEEAYKLFSEGKIAELKALTTYKNFTGKTNGIDTLTNIIFVARNVDPTLSKQDIKNALQSAPDKKPFEEQRKKEMKEFLKFLGLGSEHDQRVIFETRGVGVTFNFISRIQSHSSPPPSSSKAVMGSKKRIMDLDTAKKETILDYAFRNAMTGISKNDLKKLSKVKRKEWNIGDIQTKFINMIGNEIILDKEWNVLRINDDIIKKRVFKSNAILIGSTANPMIAQRSIISPFRPDGYKGLIFESPKGKSRSIRVKGDMIINGKEDLDELVDILGISPKNGFAPVGYEYTDDTVVQSPIFNVFFTPPESQVNIVHHPKSIIPQDTDKGRGYTITIGKSLDEYLRTHLWIADVNKLRNEKIGYTNALLTLIDEKRETLPSKYRTKNVNNLPDEYFRDTVTYGMTYGGTMCNWYKKGSDIVTRNDMALEKELDRLLKLSSKYIKTPSDDALYVLDMVKTARDHLNRKLKKKEDTKRGDTLEKKRKEIYNRSKPKCQIVDIMKFDKKRKVIFIEPGSHIAKKLDTLYDFCVNDIKSKRPEICIAKLTKVTQNLTDKYFGGEKNQSPAEKALINAIGIKKDPDRIMKTFEIAHEMLTGQKVKNEKGEPLPIKEKREILNEAKMLNKRPLNLEPWTFLDAIKGKKLKSFAKRI